MAMISYRTLLVWGHKNQGTLKVCGDAIAKLEREESLAERSRHALVLATQLSLWLDDLVMDSAREPVGLEDAEHLEAQLLHAITAPIDTRAVVLREKRDHEWLLRFHAAVNSWVAFLDDAGGRHGVSPGS